MSTPPRVLTGVRVLSLALNLPGPAALMRCRQMGATCVKLEPPARAGAADGSSGDPMGQYSLAAYRELHAEVQVLTADLKSEAGQQLLHRELARTDVLLTSFRPSALVKLDLQWEALRLRHPALSQVAIVGAPGAQAEVPGHDLTYLADHGLVPGLDLPATLFADMAGSLMASEAVLQAVLQRRSRADSSGAEQGPGVYLEVALSQAAAYLALPRQWGLTRPEGTVGGAHAGYQVYPCRDGRVAVAALEPHFAAALCEAAGVQPPADAGTMMQSATHAAIAAFLASRTRAELEQLAAQRDLPLHCMA